MKNAPSNEKVIVPQLSLASTNVGASDTNDESSHVESSSSHNSDADTNSCTTYKQTTAEDAGTCTEPSIGSILHSTGECEPCAWFWRPGGCEHGGLCKRCHLCPQGETKARKKAKKVVKNIQRFQNAEKTE